MRGTDEDSGQLFSYIDIEERISKTHPLRVIRELLNQTLGLMNEEFSVAYSGTGRPSIAPERLIRALILQALYSVRSERHLVEQIEYNFLFRWFVGLNSDEKVWSASSFSKNRERLLSHDIAPRLLTKLLSMARIRPLLSEDH